MTLRHVALAAIAALGTIVAAAPGHAQSRVQFGPHASVSDDADLGVGADVRWTFLPDDRRLALVASFDYFFPPQDEVVEFEPELQRFFERFGVRPPPRAFPLDTDVEYWEANLNLTWDFGPSATVVPYAGAGVTYARASVSFLGVENEEDDVGANVLAGLRIARRFFVEAKKEAGGGELFVLTAGVRF